jgi:hypothetical protein
MSIYKAQSARDAERTGGTMMRVRVTVIVDVDPVQWAHEYNMVDTAAKTVREDVKEYVLNGVRDTYASQSGLLTVSSS